jgi:acetyl esterase/lipase
VHFDIVIDTNTPMRDAGPPTLARWISPAAARQFARIRQHVPPPEATVEALRLHYDAINAARFEIANHRYPTEISTIEIEGVEVHRVAPWSGGDETAILICLHGGAFLWGAGAGAVLEAVPVAATIGMTVLAVEYRLAPEHRFPCAVDDVLAVLRHVRRAEPGRKIGIYGCSAGAILTAQVVARLIEAGEPLPDAIAMLHATGLELGGDSVALAAQLNGAPQATDVQCLHDLPYFEGTDAHDPLVFPGEHPDMLRSFPPSLLVSGTRDFAASAVSVMHRRLLAAGRPAELVMFDGMWHAHHMDVDLPESEEVYRLLRDFFGRHLA